MLVNKYVNKNSVINKSLLFNEQQNLLDKEEAEKEIKLLNNRPLITIIVYCSENFCDADWLMEGINKQWYTDYEIIFLIPRCTAVLVTKYACIKKVIYFEGDIPGNAIGEALNIANGQYVFPVRDDFSFVENTLFEIASKIVHGKPHAVYFDSADVDIKTNNVSSYNFLPDFSPIYLLHSFYMNNCAVAQISGLKNIYNQHRFQTLPQLIYAYLLDIAFKGAQISHIEKILLLRDYKKISDNKLYTSLQHLRTLRFFHSSLNRNLNIYIDKETFVHDFNENRKKVSIIIPVESKKNTLFLVDKILTITDYADYEIVLCTNETEFNRRYSDFRQVIICNTADGFSYSAKCNKGAVSANGDFLVFLQDSIVPKESGWLNNLTGCLLFPEAGAVSPKIIRKDNTIKYAGIVAGGYGFGAVLFNGQPNIIDKEYSNFVFTTREVSILSASCIAINRTLFNNISGFNEEYTTDKYSNIDLSLRIKKKGYSCVYCGSSELIECGENWYDNWTLSENEKGYFHIINKHADMLENDPYFTETMKKYLLNGVPLEYKIYAGKDVVRNTQPKRKILFISHELSLTGAPIALHNAAKALKHDSTYIAMISLADAALTMSVIQDGIDIIIDNKAFVERNRFIALCESFDLIIISTLVCYKAIEYLSFTNIPVIWWVHESKESYMFGANKLLPPVIGPNIHVYCGGAYAQKLLQRSRPEYKTSILIYGVPDVVRPNFKPPKAIYKTPGRLLFIIIGTVEHRKGQDIFAKAVLSMPQEIIKSADFLIIGRKIHDDVYDRVFILKKKYPENVTLINEVQRDELNEIYSCCDCIVCASRDDPMPVFIAEGMMFSKICICSENTGTAALIEDGINGFVYSNDDYRQLSKKMQYVISQYDKLGSVKQKSRLIYDDYFAMSKFTGNINEAMENALSGISRNGY